MTTDTQSALKAKVRAYCEQSRHRAEALAALCAEHGHDEPPVHARPLWWKDEPVRCRRCHGVIS